MSVPLTKPGIRKNFACGIRKHSARLARNMSVIDQRGKVITSRCHGSKISGSQQTVAEGETKKSTCLTFMCMIALRNKTVAHTFLPSFDNKKTAIYVNKLLLRSRNFATMVRWRFTSPPYNVRFPKRTLLELVILINLYHWILEILRFYH